MKVTKSIKSEKRICLNCQNWIITATWVENVSCSSGKCSKTKTLKGENNTCDLFKALEVMETTIRYK